MRLAGTRLESTSWPVTGRCLRNHVLVTSTHSLIQSYSCLCVRFASRSSLYSTAAPFSVWCVHLAVLGAVGGGLASKAHGWLLQLLAAVIAQRGIAALARCVFRPWRLVPLEQAPKSSFKPRGPTELPTAEERRADVGHPHKHHASGPWQVGARRQVQL